jgi:hypothetical protein
MIAQGAERGAAPLTSLSVRCLLPSPTQSDSCLPSTTSQVVANQGSLRLPASGLQHSWRSRKVSRPLPTEGLVIPDIPVLNEDGTRQHRRDSWQEVVKQWIEGDPKRGLVAPLKDWPPVVPGGEQVAFRHEAPRPGPRRTRVHQPVSVPVRA